MSDEQPQNFKTNLYSFLKTRINFVGPNPDAPPGTQQFPADKMFTMTLAESDGSIHTINMLEGDWAQLAMAMIDVWGQSGHPVGRDLRQWCLDNIPHK